MLNELGHKAPTFTPPVFLVKFMARILIRLSNLSSLCLELTLVFNTNLAKTILNYDPIPIEKTIKDTSDFLESYEQAYHISSVLLVLFILFRYYILYNLH